MPEGPPTTSELSALAERALARLDGPGQVGVLWERRLEDRAVRDALRVTFTAVQEGRAAQVVADATDDDHLARAAKAVVLRARRAQAWPAPPLPEPLPGRIHEGFDPALLRTDPVAAAETARAAAGEDLDVDWRAGIARTAVASTTGVRAAEQRSHVVATVRAHRPDGRAAAVGVAGVGAADVAAAAAEVRALLGEGPAAGAFGPHVPSALAEPPGREEAVPVVLGPAAVAAVLDQLRPAAGVDLALGGGPLAGRRGTRVAASAVNLSDSARFPATLPRSYDAEGVPRRPVPLIQDGVAHGQVHDSASAATAPGAASTGHATRAATLAPYPDHLVLVGGGADDVAALCARVDRGLFIPAFAAGFESAAGARRHETLGAALIAGGRLAGPVPALRVEVAALDVLAAVEALTSRQRLVALRGHCPGGIGAAVVPALRAVAGVRLAG